MSTTHWSPDGPDGSVGSLEIPPHRLLQDPPQLPSKFFVLERFLVVHRFHRYQTISAYKEVVRVACFSPPRAERQASASAIRIRERLSSGNPSTGLDSARANSTPPSQNRFWYSIRGTCETSVSSIRHSGHTGFLNHLPTLRFGHPSQYSPLHLGHCQAGALNQPPTSLPHLVQKPRTKHHII